MTKKSESPVAVTPESVCEGLKEADDFGHEMRVRTILEKHPAKVQHGWAYLDPVESKPRQFDLRCSFSPPDQPFVIQLAIECKNLSPDVPLVVSGTKRTREEAFHDFVVSDGRFPVGGHTEIRRVHGRNSRYLFHEFVGKSLMRLKPEKGILVHSSSLESEIYNRWTQAISSADELCKKAATAGNGPHPMLLQTAILPIVVVPDKTLWKAEYTSDGELVAPPAPEDQLTLFVKHEVVVVPNNHWMDLSHIHFLTVTGLRTFLAPLKRTVFSAGVSEWDEWFPAGAEKYQPPIH